MVSQALSCTATALRTLQLGDIYLAGLNLRRRFVVPAPPPLPPAPTTAPVPTPSASSGQLSSAAQAGIIAGACVAGVTITALAVVAVMVRRRNRGHGLFGPATAPGPGLNTTLVVTDVEESTTLW